MQKTGRKENNINVCIMTQNLFLKVQQTFICFDFNHLSWEPARMMKSRVLTRGRKILSKRKILTAKTPPLSRQHLMVLSMILGSDFFGPPLTSLSLSFSRLSSARLFAMFWTSLTGLFRFRSSSLSISLCCNFCSLC